jgi:spermidine synthase
MLQLIQTRILSVMVWYHLAFFVISVAMFGMTAGAVWVYLRRDQFTENTLSHDLTYFASAFAITTVVALLVQLTLVPVVMRSITSLITWTELAICMSLPFFFSGVVVSLALTRSPYPIGQVYGADMIGAAAGCLGVLLLLNSADAPSAVMWVAVFVAAGAALFAYAAIGTVPERPGPLSLVLQKPVPIAIVIALVAGANTVTDYRIHPLIVKGKVEPRANSLLFERWNSFSRVIVFRHPKGEPHLWGPSPRTPRGRWSIDQRMMNIDGIAATAMYRFPEQLSDAEFLKYDITNLAYHLPDRQRAAVIGVGGGRDVLSAMVFGVGSITAVEINPIFIHLLTHEQGFAEYAGLSTVPAVEFVTDEARSWFARTEQTFDIIQMTLIDTWAATGAGAFTLSENGLYTTEGWRIFLSRLQPEGVFTVSRWYAPDAINETGRMISVTVAALMDLGVKDVERHIFLAASDYVATLVVARAPLSAEAVDKLVGAADGLGFRILIAPGQAPASEVLRRILSARSPADLQAYTSSLDLDLTPATDNRPFFFNQLPLSKPVALLKRAREAFYRGGTAQGVATGNLSATATLGILLVVAFGLVLVTIIIPVRPALADVGKQLVIGGTGYFLLIGIGFMAVEIGLLQRMSVFLGHPIYSLSVVLFTLILATGIGSLISEKLQLESRARLMLWAIVTAAYVASLPLWLPDLLLTLNSATLGVRATLCVLIIAPAGVLMGFGFPTGMRLISAVDRKPTPWFWGINGAAGVLAAILAVACSIAFGISTTLTVGAICYLLLIPCAMAIGFRPAARA